MIKNERQYRITKAQADKFEQSLSELEKTPDSDQVLHPRLRQAKRDALRSQLEDLWRDLKEYEAARSGVMPVPELQSLFRLPHNLIRARIAAGLSQKDLAQRLGVKEQQIQRYEATDYRGASLSRLLEIIRALGIKDQEPSLIPGKAISLRKLFAKLTRVGLDKQVVMRRLLSPSQRAELESQIRRKTEPDSVFTLQLIGTLERVFRWTSSALLGDSDLQLDNAVAGSVYFKMPSKVARKRLDVYAVYAHYVARLVLKSTAGLVQSPIPTDPGKVRQQLISSFGTLSLETTLHYLWSLGIPVLPLNDPGTFHGACWRIEGRTIIVLKQRTESSARWLFDLFHELWHAGQEPTQLPRATVDADPTLQKKNDSEEERQAFRFAGDIVLDGRSEDLAKLCVLRADGRVEYLKNAVREVADDENVSVESLANYMAFRLSIQGINWWGAASNLQVVGQTPWKVARNFLLSRMNLNELSEPDRNLLMQSLSEMEE